MDAVVIGSILALLATVLVLVFVGYKVGKLIGRDARHSHKS